MNFAKLRLDQTLFISHMYRFGIEIRNVGELIRLAKNFAKNYENNFAQNCRRKFRK